MESCIQIATLNDFIFCPRSIYFHNLYKDLDDVVYKDLPQVYGSSAHQTIDYMKYSTRKNFLQGLPVYSEKYNLCGKIDIYDCNTYKLVERKKQIKTIYDGYIYQLYGQYYCLLDMGYKVEELELYSLSDNKRFIIDLPDKNLKFKKGFFKLLDDFYSFDLTKDFSQNPEKCKRCIYSGLCDVNIC